MDRRMKGLTFTIDVPNMGSFPFSYWEDAGKFYAEGLFAVKGKKEFNISENQNEMHVFGEKIEGITLDELKNKCKESVEAFTGLEAEFRKW